MKHVFNNVVNTSFVHADGFNPEEISTVAFVVRICDAFFDYAVVTVAGDVSPSLSSAPYPSTSGATAFSEHKTLTGPIAGGVVGGVLFFTVLMAGIWITCRRRRVTSSDELVTPVLEVAFSESTDKHLEYLSSSNTEAVQWEDQIKALSSSPPPNSLATSVREKQALAPYQDIGTQALIPLINGSDDLSMSSRASKLPDGEQPVSAMSSNPAVRARVAQLQAEIREIESRDALPPPY
ncbi:hypothetical protein DL96DRAFT_884154 [Flagelloscypha sp. PMI_526]|nr:hypothetical protein DL96DRAFT_884154 [Flagelloscypha sp. PMI_526]